MTAPSYITIFNFSFLFSIEQGQREEEFPMSTSKEKRKLTNEDQTENNQETAKDYVHIALNNK